MSFQNSALMAETFGPSDMENSDMENSILHLQSLLQERFESIKTTIDAPANSDGIWWLDCVFNERLVTVEFNPKLGIGISSREGALFGEKSDETVSNVEDAFRRVVRIYLSNTDTAAPREFSLRELRESQSMTQVEMAKTLSVSQASISKLENREDVLVGTLSSLISAMGGRLEIRALFSDSVLNIHIGKSATD